MDKIIIKNLRTYGILGVHAHEQLAPREIIVSATIFTDISKAAKEDDITQTIDYSTLAKHIRAYIEANKFLTVEALIESLSAEILSDERIKSLCLRVDKPNAVPEAETVSVEITRTKQN